jgi:hypothetical protein
MWLVILTIETFEKGIYLLEPIFEPRCVGNIEKRIYLAVRHFVSKEVVYSPVCLYLYVLTYIVWVIASSFSFCDNVVVVVCDRHTTK